MSDELKTCNLCSHCYHGRYEDEFICKKPEYQISIDKISYVFGPYTEHMLVRCVECREDETRCAPSGNGYEQSKFYAEFYAKKYNYFDLNGLSVDESIVKLDKLIDTIRHYSDITK